MKKQELLYLVKSQLLQAGAKDRDSLILAVSGGPDSMALRDIICQLQRESHWRIVVVHVNHGLRKAAIKDQQLVENYCKKHNLLLVIEKVDVKKRLGKNLGGAEERARELRYRALRKVAKKMKARFIVTAHTRDDQVETIVLNFLRGSGLKGLGGMREVSGDIVRPLLNVTKADLFTFIKRRRIPFVIDDTNTSLNFTRNRIRHQLLPILREYNPNLDKLLVGNSYIFSQADIILRGLAQRYLDLMSKTEGARVSISLSKLTELSPFMQAEVIKAAIERVMGDLRHLKRVHFDEIFKLLASTQSRSSKRVLGKLFVTKSYDKITVSRV